MCLYWLQLSLLFPAPAANPNGAHVPRFRSAKACRARSTCCATFREAPPGYEIWDVTNVSTPTLVKANSGIRNTHKPWWECNTGVAYLPGSKNASLACRSGANRSRC